MQLTCKNVAGQDQTQAINKTKMLHTSLPLVVNKQTFTGCE